MIAHVIEYFNSVCKMPEELVTDLERLVVIKDLKKDEYLLKAGKASKAFAIKMSTVAIIIVVGCTLWFSLPMFALKSWKPKHERNSTRGDMQKAKRLGVFVKELHYSVDGFKEPLNLKVFIEKGFKYGKYGDESDSTEIKPLTTSYYPYSICLNNNPKEDIYIRMREDQEFKFQSAKQYMERPVLYTTIVYEILQSGKVVGELKVWE
ncbi:MAG: hypothetical protein M3040_05920 [Bacteroidota bacterium]|nr:hypothetical protein [Bacteroidota bacterium]